MIPKEIARSHLLRAIELIKTEGIPRKNKPTKFALLHEGEQYPPKLVICKAGIFALGQEHPVHCFSGGEESNKFLTRLGFEIIALTNS